MTTLQLLAWRLGFVASLAVALAALLGVDALGLGAALAGVNGAIVCFLAAARTVRL